MGGEEESTWAKALIFLFLFCSRMPSHILYGWKLKTILSEGLTSKHSLLSESQLSIFRMEHDFRPHIDIIIMLYKYQ